MKTINMLALGLMMMGTAQGFTATDNNLFIESESFIRSQARQKARQEKAPKARKIDKNDHWKLDHNRQNEQVTTHEDGQKCEKGARGPKGEKGEKGEPGESIPTTYGYFYKSTNDEVASKDAILFDVSGLATDDLNANVGSIIIPEDGNYQVSYFIDAIAENGVIAGVLLNDEIVPGSIYRNYFQLQGSVILKATQGDTVKIVNLSDDALQFDDSGLSNVNASLTIKKL